MKKEKIYFASDFHLGIPTAAESLKREKLLVSWLDEISADATAVFLLGDVFDFWFEYKTVVPKGYVRLLGKLAELTDAGIPVHLFRGNHDIWAFDYLNKEVGIRIHRRGDVFRFGGKTFFLAHGDGLGPGDSGYKFLKKVFEFKPNQFLFRWLHPDLGARMGLYFSSKSRLANMAKEGKKETQTPAEEEMLFRYAQRKAVEMPQVDYFVFGHRHLPLQKKLNDKAEIIILGDWLAHFSYAVFEDGKMELAFFNPTV